MGLKQSEVWRKLHTDENQNKKKQKNSEKSFQEKKLFSCPLRRQAVNRIFPHYNKLV